MKTPALTLSLMIFGAAAFTADFAITSFDRSGKLTWTNSLVRRWYWVECANSSEGPWAQLATITNGTSFSYDTNALNTYTPLFFRIASDWPPPPPQTNVFQYSAFDSQSNLVVTGRLSCVIFYSDEGSFKVSGGWTFDRIGSATNDVGPQIGQGQIQGSVFADRSSVLWPETTGMSVALNGTWIGWNVHLFGDLFGTYHMGSWTYSSFSGTWQVDREFGPRPSGRFVADAVR